MIRLKKLSILTKVLYALTVTCLFLPWFTYNAGVMGYRRGYLFSFLFLVPMIIIGFCVFRRRNSKVLRILGLIFSFLNLIFHMLALGIWQEVCNIKAGFHFLEGLRASLPGFWFSLVMNLLLLITFFIRKISDPLPN